MNPYTIIFTLAGLVAHARTPPDNMTTWDKVFHSKPVNLALGAILGIYYGVIIALVLGILTSPLWGTIWFLCR